MDDFHYQFAHERQRAAQPDASLLGAAARGAAAGLAGTAVISLGMQYGPRLMRRYGLLPAGGQQGEPTEKLAEDIAEGVLDTPLDHQTRVAAGRAIHWGYGAAWGALYGIAQHGLRLPPPLAGAAFGGIVGGVASTVVPAMDLTPPPSEQPPAMNAFMSGIHLVYGEVTALAYALLDGR
jgi:hypothetical protein